MQNRTLQWLRCIRGIWVVRSLHNTSSATRRTEHDKCYGVIVSALRRCTHLFSTHGSLVSKIGEK